MPYQRPVETWWIVQTVKSVEPTAPHKFLCLKNAFNLRRRPKTRSGRARPRQWLLVWSKWDAHPFPSLQKARSVVRSAKLLKDWLGKDGFVEIVEVTGRRGSFSDPTRVYAVAERPGCPALLTLALEAD